LKLYPCSSTVHLSTKLIDISPNTDNEKMPYQVHNQLGHDLMFTSIGRRVPSEPTVCSIVASCLSLTSSDDSTVGVPLDRAALSMAVTGILKEEGAEALLVSGDDDGVGG